MIQVLKDPGEFCFIGNAVIFEITTDSDTSVDVEITVNNEVHYTSYVPYKKSDTYYVSMDLSGFLFSETFTADIPEGEIIVQLHDFSLPYTVKIGHDFTFTGIAFRGGISNKSFAFLANNGLDIFSYKLFNPLGLFLFTTRTNEPILNIHRSEFYPFAFIHSGLTISFKSGSGNIITPNTEAENTVCGLDIETLIQEFEDIHGETPDTIEVYTADELSFTINILPDTISEEIYRIRFRNSLGAFEVMEVTGRLYHTPEYSEANTWMKATDFWFFEKDRERLEYQEVKEVEAGYRTRKEHPFVQDMIGSDEIYFIWPDGKEDRCLVTVDELHYGERLITPNSIPLRVEMVIIESQVNPYIPAETGSKILWTEDEMYDMVTEDGEYLIEALINKSNY